MVPGEIVGVGTGSTVNKFIDALATMKGRIRGAVSSSEASTKRLKALGIAVFDSNDVAELSVYIDGADEIDARGYMIKGGGAALTREKIVAAQSRQFVCIADESKLVPTLGKFPLPFEVVEFGHKSTAARLAAALAAAGYTRVPMTLRARGGETFRTDGGNVIYDLAFGAIQNAPKLAAAISAVPGVVEHGLFIGIATTLLIAGPGDVEVIERSARPAR